jgi:hypothetical protein
MNAVKGRAMSDGFEEILSTAGPQVQTLARRTRVLIREIMPEVVEVPWPKQKIIGYGVGPKKMSEHFCYIAIFKTRLNLGFFYGAELPDPDHLLEGTGKLLRHIKITVPEQLENPAVRALVEAASRHLPRLDAAAEDN